ncbi:hypothetical protein GCM10028818_57760 [Spirosoma horti]
MNLLGFLAIIISVTGLIWLLQIIFKGKERIDINLSVGRRATSSSEMPTNLADSKKTHPGIPQTEPNSILGEVVSIGSKIPSSATSTADSSASTNPINATPRSHPTESNGTDPDAYLHKAFEDESFEEHTNESLLQEVAGGQLTPPMGQLTLSGFGSIASQLPSDSFDKPQSSEQIEAMFAVLKESTRRIEQQMIALYEVHRSMQANQDTPSNLAQSTLEDQTANDAGDYDFGADDDDNDNEHSFGGGLNTQLTTSTPDEESQSAPATEFIMTMDELSILVPAGTIQTFDASDVLEPAPEIRHEALPYFANLNKTGELGYEVVEAIKRKAPTREVRHRVRQVIRAIDHFNLNSDANAALRLTAVFRHLPEHLGEYDDDVAAIGRKFGLIEPASEPASVEAD